MQARNEKAGAKPMNNDGGSNSSVFSRPVARCPGACWEAREGEGDASVAGGVNGAVVVPRMWVLESRQ